MPQTAVYFYREIDGTSPALDWFTALRRMNKKAFANCLARLRMLKMFGHELRRPAPTTLTTAFTSFGPSTDASNTGCSIFFTVAMLRL